MKSTLTTVPRSHVPIMQSVLMEIIHLSVNANMASLVPFAIFK